MSKVKGLWTRRDRELDINEAAESLTCLKENLSCHQITFITNWLKYKIYTVESKLDVNTLFTNASTIKLGQGHITWKLHVSRHQVKIYNNDINLFRTKAATVLQRKPLGTMLSLF